jgi:hypothetical protein
MLENGFHLAMSAYSRSSLYLCWSLFLNSRCNFSRRRIEVVRMRISLALCLLARSSALCRFGREFVCFWPEHLLVDVFRNGGQVPAGLRSTTVCDDARQMDTRSGVLSTKGRALMTRPVGAARCRMIRRRARRRCGGVYCAYDFVVGIRCWQRPPVPA